MDLKSPIAFVSTFSVGLFADYVTKRFAETSLPEEGVDVLGNFVRFRYQANEGIAFSAPLTGWPLKIVTLALIVFVTYYYFKEEKLRGHAAVDIAYAAFLAGAVGNGLDRILMGKVTDFIDVKYFANCNLADIIITVSAASIVAIHFFHERKRNPE